MMMQGAVARRSDAMRRVPRRYTTMRDRPTARDSRFSPSDAARRAMLALEARDGRLRVRQNAANVGASATRNRLLDECHSDYAIFLDDDVVPDERLLLEYCRAARRERVLRPGPRRFFLETGRRAAGGRCFETLDARRGRDRRRRANRPHAGV